MSVSLINRVILIVLDSVGIGNAPDAEKYGDKGCNTLGHIAKNVKQLAIPNLVKLGIGNLGSDLYLKSDNTPIGAYGRAIEKSAGKDTTTGHWEISGLITEKALPTFPFGLPKELLNQFESKIGTKTLGNKSASGTQIIDEYGDEHLRTGYPIVYTSADSVFQIAAHEDKIPIKNLYQICSIARELLTDAYAVGRIIARPFNGATKAFVRTSNRKDFSLKPFAETVLNRIQEKGLDVIAVGKIDDIFAGYGITDSIHTTSNADGINKTLKMISKNSSGLIFVNLVDFDTNYGHRRDVEGYAKCLEEFDARLPEVLFSLKPEDVLIITADHGNDPTATGTDHTRETVPILIYGQSIQKGISLGVCDSFADIGATIADILNVTTTSAGKSFKDKLLIY